MGAGQNGPPGQDAQRQDPGNAPDQLQKMVERNALDQKRRSRLAHKLKSFQLII